jgi:hypothetical protein
MTDTSDTNYDISIFKKYLMDNNYELIIPQNKKNKNLLKSMNDKHKKYFKKSYNYTYFWTFKIKTYNKNHK